MFDPTPLRPRSITALACASIVFALGCEGRRPQAAGSAPPRRFGPALSVVDLSRGAPEQANSGILGFGPQNASFDALVAALDDAASDHDSTAVMVRFGAAPLGMARALELGDRLAGLRAVKPVFCHADELSNATLMAASRGCTKIVVSPGGEVASVGIAAEVVYLRRLLADELHLSVDILQVGKFKGAEEPLTRDGPSPEARASLEGMLTSLRGTWLEQVRAGRARGDSIAAAAEDGPYSPVVAKERGLIDDVGYADEVASEARTSTHATREKTVFGRGAGSDGEGLEEVVRVLSGGDGAGAPVVLVRAAGSIALEDGGGLLGGRPGIVARDFVRVARRLAADEAVKAVVVRIDSPGGSALASDLMWRALMDLRAKKPVVFSVGDMAASGGYYMACTASEIVAEPVSIVGSIGVVGGKIGFGDALERLGVHAEVFPADPSRPEARARAAYLSPFVSWDEATRARVLESMTAIYNLFLRRVAEGRNLPVERVAESAEGRVFTGRDAIGRGLVDRLGGLHDAVARAKELAGLRPDARVKSVGGRPSWIEALDDPSETGAAEAPSARLARATVGLELPEALVSLATSVSPMVRGERAVVAMPYALTVR